MWWLPPNNAEKKNANNLCKYLKRYWKASMQGWEYQDMDKMGSMILQDTDYYSIDFLWQSFIIQIGKLWK